MANSNMTPDDVRKVVRDMEMDKYQTQSNPKSTKKGWPTGSGSNGSGETTSTFREPHGGRGK